MEFLPLSTLAFERFVLILLRVGAIIFSVPLLSSSTVPQMVKVGLSVAVTLGLYPAVASAVLVNDASIYRLAGLALGEVTLGLIIGLLARLFITAIDLGAEVVGFQMGFGIVTAVDPTTQAHTALIAQFQGAVTALMILATNAHYFFFRAIAESFTRVSLMGVRANQNLWNIFMQSSTNLFVIAFKFAAPVTVVLLLTTIALGIVARTVPQMNIFIVGISLQIIVGFGVFFLSVSILGVLYNQVLTEMGDVVFGVLRAF